MWQVPGKPVDAEVFQPFEPAEILYEFDGPRTFTHRDRQGSLYLAHWCDADPDCERFIVVSCTESLVQKLKSGEITVRAALDQPRIWLLDLDARGEVRQVSAVKHSDLPADVLPDPGTMLWRSLERPPTLRPISPENPEGRAHDGVKAGPG